MICGRAEPSTCTTAAIRSTGELRFFDERWSLHRDFFADVGKFLKPGGMIVVVENNHGSTAETFRSMIDEAGLCTVFVRNCEGRRTPYDRMYYIGIARVAIRFPHGRLPLGNNQPVKFKSSEIDSNVASTQPRL
jgi:hypothetical protein